MMILRAARSQWVKLSRPAVLLTLLGASGAFAVLATVVTLTTATDDSGAISAPGFKGTSLADLALADGVVAGLARSGQFLGIVALALGAFVAASEYQHGTLRNLLVRQPRRLTLLAGSAVAVSGLLLAAALVATAASSATALIVAPTTDVDTTAWSASELLPGFGRMTLNTIGYSLFGAVLGILLRSPVAAIGIGTAYALPVETILGSITSAMDDVLPGRLLAAVADGTESPANAGALAAWVLLAAGVAAWNFVKRDVAH